jgi:hypothetical protein
MRGERLESRWRAWGKLVLGLFVAWLFVFQFAPWLREIGPVKDVLDSVREHGIDATALFYTEVEEFGVAEHAVRHALEFGEKE